MFEILKDWTAPYPWINNHVKFIAILIIAIISYYFLSKIIAPVIRKIAKSTTTLLDDIILSEKVLNKASLFIPAFLIQSFSYLEPKWESLIIRLVSILFVLIFTMMIANIMSGVNELYEKNEKYRDRPIKGYIQIIKIVLYVMGTMMIIGIIIGRSPLEIIAGLGVFAAILALLFRDIILSFVASIQISSYDLVRVGDWIESSKFGADGDVVDISLTVIKVQNWDKTITIIPTYKLIEDSFKNWRGMKTWGARRIKRAINIDQTSIKFCTDEMLERFSKISLISDYIRTKREEIEKYNTENKIDTQSIVNGRRLTNIGVFRQYLNEFIKQRNDVNRNYFFMVRHLQSGETGLPVEIYLFADTTEWLPYENIQADLFDHIISVVPQFELNIFQNPSGSDFKKLFQS
ncbi:MAG: mechanosensitive ion channel protein MscS [Ignavibacteriae bacterium HGW-Ignavibacteriae-3]|nr:MAG: mechanosensitive ion channel protein MscS [Ignavibacteriae bacterium HGW-Ignavibacteriae-3]